MSAPSLTARLSPADERLGMAWWNAMSPADRIRAMEAAEAEFSRHVSVADAWIVWQRAQRSLAAADESRTLGMTHHGWSFASGCERATAVNE
jgi:hypothetical protein